MDSSGASPAQNDRERNDNLGCHARPDRASLRKCLLDEIPACAGMTGKFKRGNDTISQQVPACARMTKVGRMTGEKTK